MENTQARVVLKKGREKSIQGRHPWLFSGGIDRVEGQAEAGDILPLYSSGGELLGKGFYNPHSQISLRLLSFGDATIDADFFKQKFMQMRQARCIIITGDFLELSI